MKGQQARKRYMLYTMYIFNTQREVFLRYFYLYIDSRLLSRPIISLSKFFSLIKDQDNFIIKLLD